MTLRLKRLLEKLGVFTAKQREVKLVDKSERITRYILSRNQYSPGNGRVKHNAFMPPRSLLLSVYRSSDLDEDNVWGIGDDYVAAPQEKTIKARADLIAGDVFTLGLKVQPETSVHELHADIANWPTEKHEQQMLAVELANKSKLYTK